MRAKDSEPSDEVKMEVVSKDVFEVLFESISGSADCSPMGDPVLEDLNLGAWEVDSKVAGEGAVAPRGGGFLFGLPLDEAESAVSGESLDDLRSGLTERSGWAFTKALKLGSDLASGIFQGNRLRTMQRKMMATLQTSVFLGS